MVCDILRYVDMCMDESTLCSKYNHRFKIFKFCTIIDQKHFSKILKKEKIVKVPASFEPMTCETAANGLTYCATLCERIRIYLTIIAYSNFRKRSTYNFRRCEKCMCMYIFVFKYVKVIKQIFFFFFRGVSLIFVLWKKSKRKIFITVPLPPFSYKR